MALRQQIKDEIKEAMKAKDVFKRDTLRLLDSALKQIEVDERRELSDEDVLQIIKKQVKQRQEAASQYKDAGREDLYEKEVAEQTLFESYLPAQLSDEELKSNVHAIIEQVGASSMKDMGKVMGTATKTLGDVADGKRINLVVKELLS
jgi:uncharacterized protein YqeY